MGIRTIYFRSGTGSFKLPVDFDPSQSLTMLAIGGGGGGARPPANVGSGGGGGGGALARGTFSGLSPGDLIYYSIGAGGTGGQSNGASGGAGGTTWGNVVSNAAPSNSSQGVLAVGGNGGTYTGGGTGGSSTSCLGNLAVQSGGNGGNGGTSRGSGGAGGGSAGNWNGSTYNNGYNGGNGFNTTGDGGGGGGGGVNSAGTSASSRNGAAGGLSYTNTSAAGGTSSSLSGGFGAAGGGGGGGYGRDNNRVEAWAGGNGGPASINTQTGALSHGWSGGGGGGGAGTNNSGTTGGRGGSAGGPGGGGGGGGTGLTNGGTGGTGGNGILVITYTAKTTMLPSSGALSFRDIRSYFGKDPTVFPGAVPMNSFYAGGSLVNTYARNASDVAVPSSGQISVSNFYGAPFKLYRELRHGGIFESDYKYYEVSRSGFDSTTSVGSLNSTGFTLSGGGTTSIRTLYWYRYVDLMTFAETVYFEFSLNTTSTASNSGWSHLIINDTIVFARSAATFGASTNIAQWQWTSPTNPFTDYSVNIVPEGATFMVAFV